MSEKRETVKFNRVSSRDQRDGFSLDAQERAGKEYAKSNSLKLVKTWAVDESASKESERKHFFAMLEYIKEHNIKDVVFDKVDRAVRGFKSAVLIEEAVENNVRFHFIKDHLVVDRDSPPAEKLRFYLGTILGKHYIDNLKVEIRKGIDERTKRGLWNGKAPFGYKNAKKDGKAVIEVNKDQSSIAIEVFELYATGNYGYDDLAELISIKAGKKVTKRIVENMIVNPFYYGDMKIKGKILKGIHEPLIKKSLFASCQKIKAIRAKQSQSKRKGLIPKPFMGLLKCGECDHAVTGESRKKASGKTYVYYHCANKKCDQYRKTIEHKDLFKFLEDAFKPFGRWSPKATEAFIRNIHSSLQDLDLYTQKVTGELASARMELKKRIEQLDVHLKKGTLNQAEYDAAVAVPNQLLEDKNIEIKAYQAADLKTFEQGCRVIKLFHKLSDYMSLEGNELDKIRLAKEVLSNPILKDRSLCYSYRKPFDVLLNLTSVPVWWRRPESEPAAPANF